MEPDACVRFGSTGYIYGLLIRAPAQAVSSVLLTRKPSCSVTLKISGNRDTLQCAKVAYVQLHEDWPDLSLGELPKFLQGLDEEAKDKYRTTPPRVDAWLACLLTAG